MAGPAIWGTSLHEWSSTRTARRLARAREGHDQLLDPSLASQPTVSRADARRHCSARTPDPFSSQTRLRSRSLWLSWRHIRHGRLPRPIC